MRLVRLKHVILVCLVLCAGLSSHAQRNLAESLGNTLSQLNETIRNKWSETLCQCEIPNPSEIAAKKEAQAWTKVGFKDPTFETVQLAQPLLTKADYTHELEVSFVIFRDTGWTPLLARNAMREVANILNQCRIKLAPAKLVTVTAPEQWHDVTYPVVEYISEKTPPMKKPVFYFVRSSDPHHTAFAWPQFSCQGNARCDTAWITSEITTADYKKKRHPTYSPVAHELAHLIGNTDHYDGDEKNLLGPLASKVSATLTKEQCDAFMKYPAVRKL